MEGKETRFGIASSALFVTVTTDASCGAINSAHDSLTPIGGSSPCLPPDRRGDLRRRWFGSIGMLLYAIVAVFIAGLMVGRTPEYLGKKIQQKEVKMAMLPILGDIVPDPGVHGVSIVMPFAKGSYWNSTGPPSPTWATRGPHGFSEMLYAYSSTAENNGSAFAGLNANSPWFNITTGLAMQFGRFMFIIPLLAVAGSLAAQKRVPSSSGTFPTHGPLFMGLLVATVLVVGALTFFPALALGPIM